MLTGNGSSAEFTDLQHTSIMIGAFVGAVCLLSVCWLIAMARKRYQDEPAPGTGHHHRIVSVHTLGKLNKAIMTIDIMRCEVDLNQSNTVQGLS